MTILRVLRNLHNESIDDLAERVGIHRSSLQLIDAGRCDAGSDVRDKLSELYGIEYKILKKSADAGLVNDVVAFIRGRCSV